MTFLRQKYDLALVDSESCFSLTCSQDAPYVPEDVRTNKLFLNPSD